MALYLKYRPLDFSSLTGQDFIKKTLKAAVAGNKTVGAYIFTGPRGTGKTSTARIFAKAINCENPKDGDPDLTCGVCQAFADENLIDVIEIDAASHTGVDNIREIIEKAQFRPTQAKYKIYIVDEVHMLSKGAFNALLKILEEPPKHVKFILATTEIHKVPDTILSRCQRYDFKNFSPDEIIGRLEFIANSEGIQVDRESYEYIVKSAEGGMRNAVSLFEQLISGDTISFSHITQTLGIMGEDEKQDFVTKLIKKDISLLSDYDKIVEKGKNLKNFFKDILGELQSISILSLHNNEDISEKIQIMDCISESLTKAKHSFDEVLTYRIGLLKILSGYQENVLQEQTNTAPVIKKSPEKVKNPKIETKGEDIIASAQDIFATSDPMLPIEKTEASLQKSGQGFDVNALILAAKQLGGKAALSMTLKGSTFDLQGEIMQIQAKTSIARSTLDKTDNRDVLFEAFKEIGMVISDIRVI